MTIQNMIFQNLKAKGGGDGLVSRANIGSLDNLGNDRLDGGGYGLPITAGSGGGGNSGGGGRAATSELSRGRRGASSGTYRKLPQGITIPEDDVAPSGGAGTGSYDTSYTVEGGVRGAAVFVDSDLNFATRAFNTSGKSEEGTHGTGVPGGRDGVCVSSALTFMAQDIGDLLTLGTGVAFADDAVFGAGETDVFVIGNGTVVYNGTTDYQGNILINNANFKVNGQIDQASLLVSRNSSFSAQRGTLSGVGTLTGDVFVNSGTISPDPGAALTLGSLTLNPADPGDGNLGSLVHIKIDSPSNFSSVTVTGPAQLAGTLEIDLDPSVNCGMFKILTSQAVTGSFDSVTFTGPAPDYALIYDPKFVQFNLLSLTPSTVEAPSNLKGILAMYNQLEWTPSPSADVIGYYIYRTGKKIAEVSASTHTYKDHKRKKGVSYRYAVTAFNSAGSESARVKIVIKDKK